MHRFAKNALSLEALGILEADRHWGEKAAQLNSCKRSSVDLWKDFCADSFFRVQRSHRQADHELTDTCPFLSSMPKSKRPRFGRIPAGIVPNVVKSCRSRAPALGQLRPTLPRNRPNTGDIDRSSAEVGQRWLKSGRCRPMSVGPKPTTFWPGAASFKRISPNSARIRPNFEPFWSTWTQNEGRVEGGEQLDATPDAVWLKAQVPQWHTSAVPT